MRAEADGQKAKQEWESGSGWGSYYMASIVGLVGWGDGRFSALLNRQHSGS